MSGKKPRRKCQCCGQTKAQTQFYKLQDGTLTEDCLVCLREQGVLAERKRGNTAPKLDYEALKDRKRRRAAKRELAQRELATRRLIPYIKRFNPKYKDGWVHHAICEELERFYEQVQRGESPRLMLFVPPRHGKSEIASDFFPSWALGKDPSLEIIASSYSAALPTKFSKRNRERLRSQAYQQLFPTVKLHAENQNADAWQTNQGGGYIAAGVGGSLTGFGAHIFIIDDPVKDAEEADSEAVRASNWDWWSSVASTRVEPGGGVLVIQCMTGDTLVLMADGSEKRLDAVRPGDVVMSWKDGALVPRKVLNWAHQGCDSVFRITTSSGKVAKGNERHPFLVRRNGEYEWIRLRNLAPGDVMVGRPEAPGQGKSAMWTVAKGQLSAEAFARRTTTNGSGLTFRDRLRRTRTLGHGSMRSLSIATALRSTITKHSWLRKVTSALSVGYQRLKQATLNTGPTSYVLTTATTVVKSVASFVTAATSLCRAGIRRLFSKPPQPTFVEEAIVTIEPAGEEDVYDIEVEDTHNFIANALVSSNTRWHDDDLSGRMINQMEEAIDEGIPDDEIEKWNILSFPAIADDDEYRLADGRYAHAEHAAPEDLEDAMLLRRQGEALHPERWPLSFLKKKRRSMVPRHWNALYQQNPIPDEGDFFLKADMRYANFRVNKDDVIIAAMDLAISSKKKAAYSVLAVGALEYTGRLKVIDVQRGRWGVPEIVSALVTLGRTYGTQLAAAGLEEGQIKEAVMPELRKEMQRTRVYIPMDHTLRPIDDKEVRARPLQGMIQTHNLVFPNNEPWVPKTVAEVLRFPAGRYKDIVDALAWLARMALDRELPPPPPHKRDSVKRKLDKELQQQRRKSPMAA